MASYNILGCNTIESQTFKTGDATITIDSNKINMIGNNNDYASI